MALSLDKNSFANWLDTQAAALKLEAIASLDIKREALGKFKELYADEKLADMPPYLLRVSEIKRNPAGFLTWAKTILIATGSFRALPQAPSAKLFKLAQPDSPTAGILSGYCLRLDYHRFAKEAMNKLSNELDAMTGAKTKSLVGCDSNPLPERALALTAGLGALGLHRCLLSSHTRDGVFIATLASERLLPERLFEVTESDFCNHCGACVSACQNNALAEGKFHYANCVEALGGELRGALTLEQVRKMGFWLAGCGECVRECPRSKMPPPEHIDLEWLLLCPSSELEGAIASTALAHEGVAQLRRNALCALFNRGKQESLALIRRFVAQTGSARLKEFAETLIRDVKVF